MIRNQLQCPYCNSCVAAYDWDADKIVFNPDLAKPDPCDHVAYVGAYCVTQGHPHSHRHAVWMHPAADESLRKYLRAVGNGTAMPDAVHELITDEHEHQHKGGTDSVLFQMICAPDPKVFLRVCLEDENRRNQLGKR